MDVKISLPIKFCFRYTFPQVSATRNGEKLTNTRPFVRLVCCSSGSSFVWFVVRLVRSTRHGRKFFWALRAQKNFKPFFWFGRSRSGRPRTAENLGENLAENLGENLDENLGENLDENLGEIVGEICLVNLLGRPVRLLSHCDLTLI